MRDGDANTTLEQKESTRIIQANGTFGHLIHVFIDITEGCWPSKEAGEGCYGRRTTSAKTEGKRLRQVQGIQVPLSPAPVLLASFPPEHSVWLIVLPLPL